MTLIDIVVGLVFVVVVIIISQYLHMFLSYYGSSLCDAILNLLIIIVIILICGVFGRIILKLTGWYVWM